MPLFLDLNLMNNASLQQALTHCQTTVNQEMANWLAKQDTSQTLIQAMQYSSLQGGKRIRPFLVYQTGLLLGASESTLHTAAVAIEFIHSYSLIHDDLPDMDNDDLRRGHKTCHVQFDPATAILAGDALQCLGFEVLANGYLDPKAEPFRIKMIQALGQAAGSHGMCMGQALDLYAENHSVTLKQLEKIHKNKTGALIRCAVRLGALAAGVTDKNIFAILDKYASAIGLAFQVQDDILDITANTQELGKPSGSDLEAHKSTYPSLLGLDLAQQKAQDLYDEAVQALSELPFEAKTLALFAHFIIQRHY